jgi:peroxiredoxin 2/4
MQQMRIFMKKALFVTFFHLLFFSSVGFSDPMVGETAPSFIIETPSGKLHFPEDFLGEWTLLFSVPNIKTPVCSLELTKCLEMMQEWKDLHCRPLLVTCHEGLQQQEWLSLTLQRLEEAGEKVLDPTFLLLLPDPEKKIVSTYQMIHPGVSKEKPLRATYLIDPKGKIRFLSFYPMKNGRNFEEIARILAAIQMSDENSKFTTSPDWQKGEDPINCAPCSQGLK